MTKEDIFNSDKLPEKIKATLKNQHNKFRGLKGQMLELFELKEVLSIDDLIVGMYNKYKHETDRRTISVNLSFLKQENYIERVGIGEYKLK